MTARNAVASSAADEDRTTDIGVLSGLVGYHLRRASAIASADFDRAVGDLGIRQTLFGILSIIARNPGINQGMVGQALGIKRANMVALVNELVELGHVDRRVAPQDRRALSLDLTASGAAAFDECVRRIQAHEARLLAPLAASDRREIVRLLKRLVEDNTAI